MNKFSAEQVQAALASLPGWQRHEQREAIRRQFVFADFPEAFAFMTQIAIVAETRNHHPEWSNVYNKVDIILTTHEAQGVTERDVELARFADQAHARFLA